MTPKRLFAELCDEPVVVVTGDQDWAPDWALTNALETVQDIGVPFHLFVTNGSPALGAARTSELVGLGIHPNFLPGSTQGETQDEVIDTVLTLVPDANTFRTHSLCEDNHVLRNLARRGFVADSNSISFLQPELVPVLHAAGLLRLPIFFEDDWFLEWAAPELDLRVVKRQLLTPGLKVLNVHPVLFAINAPSMDYYNAARGDLYGASAKPALAPFAGRGVATLFAELVHEVVEHGVRVVSFGQLVDDALACVRTAYGDDLYGWPRHPLLHDRPGAAPRSRTRSR